jgi:hypothetical protein
VLEVETARDEAPVPAVPHGREASSPKHESDAELRERSEPAEGGGGSGREASRGGQGRPSLVVEAARDEAGGPVLASEAPDSAASDIDGIELALTQGLEPVYDAVAADAVGSGDVRTEPAAIVACAQSASAPTVSETATASDTGADDAPPSADDEAHAATFLPSAPPPPSVTEGSATASGEPDARPSESIVAVSPAEASEPERVPASDVGPAVPTPLFVFEDALEADRIDAEWSELAAFALAAPDAGPSASEEASPPSEAPSMFALPAEPEDAPLLEPSPVPESVEASQPSPEAPLYVPRKSDLSELLAGFAVQGSRSLGELSHELKRIAGVAVTPGPAEVTASDPVGNASSPR